MPDLSAESLDIVNRLLADPPIVHRMDGAPEPTMGVWSTDRDCYEFLARHCSRGTRTLETGTGLSTVLFAALGTQHQVITARQYEADNVLAYCAQKGIPTDSVTYEIGFSHEVLPRLTGELDLLFVDGGHGFPTPIIDWFYGADRLREGGLVVFDDLALPAVRVVAGYLDSDPRWEVVQRTEKWVAYRRGLSLSLAEDWFHQRFYDPHAVGGLRSLAHRARALLVRYARRRHRQA